MKKEWEAKLCFQTKQSILENLVPPFFPPTEQRSLMSGCKINTVEEEKESDVGFCELASFMLVNSTSKQG